MEPPESARTRPDETELIQGQADTAVNVESVAAGTILDGKYEIKSRIASGGMGTIYHARHVEMGNDVAIKILHPRYAADPDGMKRFQREARIIAGLRHPNILTVYAFGNVNGLVYMAMEFVEGLSLGEQIRDRGPMTLQGSLPILEQICDAMTFAHQHEVFHRDLKPDNVIIVRNPDGSPTAKLIDFGLAKLLDGTEGQRLTKTGEVLGDPNYMSPEQAQGQQLDRRSDIYSFGCALYEIFTGAPPFKSETPVAVLFKQVSEKPAPFAQRYNLPPGLEAIVFTALAKGREQRYESFDDLKEVLKSVAADPGFQVTAPSFSRSSKKGVSRRPLMAAAFVAGIIGLVTVGMIVSHLNTGQENAAAERKLLSQQEEVLSLLNGLSHDKTFTLDKLDELEQAAKRMNNSAALSQIKTMQATMLLNQGDHERAFAAIMAGLEGHGLSDYDEVSAREVAARVAHDLKKLDVAEKLYVQLVSGSTYREKHKRVLDGVFLADIKADVGKRESALELCDVATREFSSKPEIHEFQGCIQLALLNMKLGRLAQAEDLLKRLPSSPRSNEFTSWASSRSDLLRRAQFRLLVLKGDFEAAQRLENESVSQFRSTTEETETLSRYADIFTDSKQFARAEKTLKRARSSVATNIPGADMPVLISQMHLFNKQGNYSEAARIGKSRLGSLLGASGLPGETAKMRQLLGVALHHLGRMDELAAIDTNIRALTKQNAMSYNYYLSNFPSGQTSEIEF